jgi:hypothetical protein
MSVEMRSYSGYFSSSNISSYIQVDTVPLFAFELYDISENLLQLKVSKYLLIGLKLGLNISLIIRAF